MLKALRFRDPNISFRRVLPQLLICFRMVRQALASDADANTWDANGRRPLHDLCQAVAGGAETTFY